MAGLQLQNQENQIINFFLKFELLTGFCHRGKKIQDDLRKSVLEVVEIFLANKRIDTIFVQFFLYLKSKIKQFG